MFPDYQKFAARYCDAREKPWGYDDNGSSNAAVGATALGVAVKNLVAVGRVEQFFAASLPLLRHAMCALTAPAFG